MLDYLRFWWNSTNEHGIHSPFLFQWVTLCLYRKSELEIAIQNQKKTGNHNIKIMLWVRMLQYFDPKNIKVFGKHKNEFKDYHHLWKHQFPKIKSPEVPYPFATLDLILWTSEPNAQWLGDIAKNPPSQTIIVFLNSKSINTQKSFFKNAVTVNLFHAFVVFFRNEQNKEHFTIRLKNM